MKTTEKIFDRPRHLLKTTILLMLLFALTTFTVYRYENSIGFEWYKPKPRAFAVDQAKYIRDEFPLDYISTASAPKGKPVSQEEYIQNYILKICELYPDVDPYLIMGQVWAESRYDPNAVSKSGEHVGLMQVSTKWHAERAERLGIEDLFDIYGNLFVGINYMAELIDQTGSPALSLMIYNMGYVEPYKLLDQGIISEYAKQVLEKAEEYRNEFK